MSFLLAILDRFRGDGGKFTIKGVAYKVARPFQLLAIGYLISILLGVYWGIEAVKISIGVGIGFTFGWGLVIGSALNRTTPLEHKLRNPSYKWEWWQFGILKTNTYIALAFRGLMIGAPLLIFGLYLYAGIVSLAYGISFPLSIYIVTRLNLKDGWGKQEYLRSGIAGLIVGLL